MTSHRSKPRKKPFLHRRGSLVQRSCLCNSQIKSRKYHPFPHQDPLHIVLYIITSATLITNSLFSLWLQSVYPIKYSIPRLMINHQSESQIRIQSCSIKIINKIVGRNQPLKQSKAVKKNKRRVQIEERPPPQLHLSGVTRDRTLYSLKALIT